MFEADELEVAALREGVEAVSAPRIVIPGKTLAPAPGVEFAPLGGAVEVDPEIGLFESTRPVELLFGAAVLEALALPPGSVPGNVRFGCGEIAKLPRPSPAGTETG